MVSNTQVDSNKYQSRLDFDILDNSDFPNYYDFYEEKMYYVNCFQSSKNNFQQCQENINTRYYDSFYCDSRTKLEFKL